MIYLTRLFYKRSAVTNLISVKSMEATDEEMDLFDDFSTLPTMQNKNDPWAPMPNNPTDIPKLLVALKDPLRNTISSETYVKSLERRMNKIKGMAETVKAKDMIESIHETRDMHVSQYMSHSTTNIYSECLVSDTNESVVSAIQRRLNPDKQALNPLELVPLVQEDVLSKTVAELDDTESTEGTCCEDKT